MIVNTAYIYMGVGGGTPANPNLWQDRVSNYPVVFTGDCSLSSAGLNFTSKAGAATFSELPLTYFNGLTITGRTIAGGSITSKTEFNIYFYSNDDVLLGTATAAFTKSGGSVTVDIPSSAKIQNAKIKIGKSGYSNTTSTLSSAVLS